ncbi:unnamed protein product [Hymenolepis diminuta]|uniref:Rab-GAP TBC domain-containing protein n=1 Tax=Hymenolepis diminuta TaxID=6216 RepID=A0A564Y9M1_HYMDI|nr:unnamed protein product [Hymenolepis diminuta]
MHPQICGYLEPKHAEHRKLSLASPLFTRRKDRREWIVLDDEGLQLLAFQDEDAANNPKRDPNYTVPLANAFFCIEPEIPRAFSILSHRKYTYQAETNNAMMAWLNCLQICRDTRNDGASIHNSDDTLEQPEGCHSMISNRPVSDNYLLRNLQRNYSFTSFKSGLLKLRSPTEDDTGSTDSHSATSPQNATTKFFPDDKMFNSNSGSPPPTKFMQNGSNNGSLESAEMNQFLKAELQQALEKLEHLRKLNESMDSELHDLRIGYTSLLQSCYVYKLDGSMENGQNPEFHISPRHKERVGKLLQIARKEDPRLPSSTIITSRTGHTDAYGFKQSFDSEESTMLYLSSRLLSAYSVRSPEEERKIMQWNELLESNFNLIPRKRLKELCRQGIPSELREQVWTKLIDLAIEKYRHEKGTYYYQSLVNRVNDGQVKASHKRQITLDVLRTFPNHIAFNRPEGFGVQKIQEVLQAFTLHNPTVGYCQGMNFIVGNASLFLDKETIFWLLVLIVEHFFPPNYFNDGLIAAQADQIILRNLIDKYCPRLSETMQNLEVDISTITFNWFIAVFVNSVPIETLLRIWDVFLLEGEKVIFRVAVALLMRQEDVLIRQSDTLAFWKSMKTAVSIVYDHKTLMNTAFGGFKMIKRKEIRTRRETKMRDLEKRLRQSANAQNFNLKERITNPANFGASNGPHISCASALDDSSPCFIMCYMDNNEFSVKLGNTDEDVYYPINTQFEAPILCATWIKDQYILLGSAEGYLYSFNIEIKEIAWEMKMGSAVTAIAVGQRTSSNNSVFVGMANGTLSLIMDLVGDTSPRDLFSQTLGFTAISSIVVIDEQVWCACGCSVEIFDVITFDHVRKITISDNPLDNISSMAACPYGVWLFMVGKTSLKLWSTATFEPVSQCDIEKYAQSKAADNSDDNENPDRITAILANDSNLFIGTASGTVFIYKTLKWKSAVLPQSM